MPELDDLEAFARVVEMGGLSRAAARLGVAKSVVSRRLARLERDLGARLLARTRQGMTPTEAGAALHRRAERVLDELQAAREELQPQDGTITGTLRVSAPLSFGVTHLPPVLIELAAAHPRLALDVSFSDRVADLGAERLDAAIRIGSLPDSNLIARRICPLRGVLVASPAYLARAGKPSHPRDLARHECIVFTNPPDGDLWRFRDGRRWLPVRVRGRLRFDNGEAMREAAVGGFGIAALPTFVASPALGSGALVPVLTDWTLPERGLYVVRPPGPVPAKVRVLTDLIAMRLGPEPYWDPCWAVRSDRDRLAS